MGTHWIEKDFNTNIHDHLNGQKISNIGPSGDWCCKASGTKLTGPQLDELWKNYLLIIKIGYPNMSLVTLLWGNMQQWHFRSSAQCLRCSEPQEDKPHIMACPAPVAWERWEKSFKALESWLQEENMERTICEQLMSYLRNSLEWHHM